MNPKKKKINLSSPDSNLETVKNLFAGLRAEAKGLKKAAGGSVTDSVAAAWLAPQFLLAARQNLDAADENARFELLRAFIRDWALLRRGDHSAARLQLEREALELKRANTAAQRKEESFPTKRGGLSTGQLKQIEKELNLL